MQTTLLGFAIAIILALVTALVGPFFVDWDSYRGELEARASRLTGLEIRVAGPIEARLLPTPSLMLQGIEFGRRDEAGSVRARAVRVEFALGSLVRGEWRISDARLEGPEFATGLDGSGRLVWPVPKIGFDPEGVAIERLTIEDGRAILSDAASGARLVLDKLEFKGELRSLAGPIKGEGSVVVAGQHYPYRVAANRIAEDTVRVRLAVDPIDRPLTAEADVSISLDRDKPRFEGSLQFARPVGRAPAGGQALIIEPWRVTSRIKGDGTAAALEQIEFQYGPDDRATKLRGSANLTFGRQPEIVGTLSSPQLDLDRVLALPEATRRRPLAAIRTLAESLTGALRLPVPATVSLSVDTVTLGGATLQRVGAELQADGERLNIKGLDFRAPGVTQVHLKGRLGTTSAGVQLEGSTKVEANDPRALLAWLTDRTDPQAVAAGPLRLAGEVTLGNDAIAIDGLRLEVDRMSVAGRFGYAWANDSRPARLDAALTTPEIDLDRVHAFAKALLGDTTVDWPRQGALSLKIARAAVAGVEAKQADVNMRIDADGIEIEQFSIADFGGAALAVKGRVDTRSQSPRGALALDLDARALDGVIALVDKFAPQAAEQLRQAAGRVSPLALRASLAFDPGPAGSAGTNAKLKIDGRAGAFRVALHGDGSVANDTFKIDNIAAGLGAAKVNLAARLEADNGGALADLVGLDRFLTVDQRPGRLVLSAIGPLDGQLAVEGQLVAGPLDISTNGTLRVAGRAGSNARPSAGLDLRVANASIRSPRPGTAGRPADPLPASVTARLALSDGTLRLTNLKGTVAGTSIGGRLAVGMRQQPTTVDGDIEVGAVDLPAAIAMAVGIPAPSAGAGASTIGNGGSNGGSVGHWPAEPFEAGFHRLSGQIAVKSARVTLTPKLAGRDVQGVLRFSESEFAVQAIDGTLAGGRIAGDLTFLRRAEGLTARSRIKLAAANAAELLPGEVLSGRLTLDVTAEGTGLSAVALIGSLDGGGTFTLEGGRLARLDPAAFDAVIRAVDQGLPIDAGRVRDKMDSALAGGGLAIAHAEGTLTINAGQARLSNTSVRAQRADLAASGSVNLAEAAIDARLTMSGAAGAAAPANTRPEIVIALKGPIETPRRTIDVAALASWLALRAVEQQSKKLDVLEGREPPPAPPVESVPPESAPLQSGPAVAPAAPSAARTEPDAVRPRPLVRNPTTTPSAPKPKPPTTEQAQPLPPPIDIRPAPAPRAAAAPAQQAKPPAAPPPTPPRPRSLSEILFGR